MQRNIIITAQSVWLVEQGEESAHVVGRSSFGYHMPGDRDYSGPIVNGTPRIGGCLVVKTEQGHVTSGAIERIITDDAASGRQAALAEFDYVAGLAMSLGRSIGFEGISRGPGMTSVEALISDLRRAVTSTGR